MFVEKNTYPVLEENKEKLIEALHDYFKNLFYMKCLDQALGPQFPGSTSRDKIQILNIFYLNAFSSLLKEEEKIEEVKKALKKLSELMTQDYRNNPDIFSKIMFMCGMFKEHFQVNLAGIPPNMLQYIIDSIDSYNEGVKTWSNND